MCGILAIIKSPDAPETLRPRAVALAKTLRHRGPDWSGIHLQQLEGANGRGVVNVLAHERLAIVDPEGGAQPLLNEAKNVALSVNGEIYNHRRLEASLTGDHRFATRSDCEVIVHLYEERGPDFVGDLDGVFAFVLADENTGEVVAARDPIGVVPLYWGHGRDGSLWFASEMKALQSVCPRFEQFPPGHVYANGELRRYYDPSWRDTDALFEAREHRFPENTPQTREAYLYRSIFEDHFPEPAAVAAVVVEPSIACSSAVALKWEAAWESAADPSGRAIETHHSAYSKD